MKSPVSSTRALTLWPCLSGGKYKDRNLLCYTTSLLCMILSRSWESEPRVPQICGTSISIWVQKVQMFRSEKKAHVAVGSQVSCRRHSLLLLLLLVFLLLYDFFSRTVICGVIFILLKLSTQRYLALVFWKQDKAFISFSHWLGGCSASKPFRMHPVHHYSLIITYSP